MNYKTIGIVGGFALARVNIGYQLAHYLSEIGHQANLIIRESQLHEWKMAHPDIDPYQCTTLKIIPHRKYENRLMRQLREILALRQYDLVISVALGGMWYLPFLKKPYVSYATGADLSELAAGRGYNGYQVKQAQRVFRKAILVFHSAEFGHYEMINKLGLKNTVPWRQFVDIDFWKTAISVGDNVETRGLRIFHPAALQWIPKFEGQRLKSNNVLFTGFRLFLDGGGRGKLYYRKRGQDIKKTEELIQQLGLTSHVEGLIESSSSEETKGIMLKMDVIADQFGVGNFGLIALEAMSLGKPVISYLPEEVSNLSYPTPDEPPPVLNASNPEEIAEQLHQMQNTKKLFQCSMASRQWIVKYHDPNVLARWYWSHIEKHIYKNFIT